MSLLTSQTQQEAPPFACFREKTEKDGITARLIETYGNNKFYLEKTQNMDYNHTGQMNVLYFAFILVIMMILGGRHRRRMSL